MCGQLQWVSLIQRDAEGTEHAPALKKLGECSGALLCAACASLTNSQLRLVPARPPARPPACLRTPACPQYEGPDSLNPLAFRHYNADEEVMGRKMHEWLRFSMAFWHTMRGDGADPFGAPTKVRLV